MAKALLGGVIALYLAGLAGAFYFRGPDKYSIALARAASQVIAAQRSGQALKKRGPDIALISALPARTVCSVWLLETLWRRGCIALEVQAHALGPRQLNLMLGYLRAPCKAPGRTVALLEPYGCRNGALPGEKTVTVLIWHQPASPSSTPPERQQITAR